MRQAFFCPDALHLWATPLAAQTLAPDVVRYPDLILHNGKIVTMDDKSNSACWGPSLKR